MTPSARVRPTLLRLLLASVVVLLATGTAAVMGSPQDAARGSATQKAGAGDAVLQEFQQRLKGYLDLRESLTRKLAPLKSTDDTAVLVARQDSLAAAIRENRKGAKPGDLMGPAIAERLRAAVIADLKARTPEERHAVYAEVAQGVRLGVNRTFPASAALPTVPPLLLNALPALPDNLQYRFVDRALILLDGDTQIIADYITNVLPPK